MKKNLLVILTFIMTLSFFGGLRSVSAETVAVSDQERYSKLAKNVESKILVGYNFRAEATSLSVITRRDRINLDNQNLSGKFGAKLLNDFFTDKLAKINNLYSSK